MITFDQFWQLMYDHGSRNYYKSDTFITWNNLTPEQQQKIYERIEQKISTGRFVDYNPLEAIHDNLPRGHALSIVPPTNYLGKQLPRGFTYYKADIIDRCVADIQLRMHDMREAIADRRKRPTDARKARQAAIPFTHPP